MNDTLVYILGFALFFGSLHLALKVPLSMARIVFKLVKYGIIMNFLLLVLAFRSLCGDTRFGMLMGGAIWAPIVLCLVGGRADDYERSKNNCGHSPICKGVCKGGSVWRASA